QKLPFDSELADEPLPDYDITLHVRVKIAAKYPALIEIRTRIRKCSCHRIPMTEIDRSRDQSNYVIRRRRNGEAVARNPRNLRGLRGTNAVNVKGDSVSWVCTDGAVVGVPLISCEFDPGHVWTRIRFKAGKV